MQKKISAKSFVTIQRQQQTSKLIITKLKKKIPKIIFNLVEEDKHKIIQKKNAFIL